MSTSFINAAVNDPVRFLILILGTAMVLSAITCYNRRFSSLLIPVAMNLAGGRGPLWNRSLTRAAQLWVTGPRTACSRARLSYGVTVTRAAQLKVGARFR